MQEYNNIKTILKYYSINDKEQIDIIVLYSIVYEF